MSPCFSPLPRDDVTGYINDNGEVEVHALTCPRAQMLKAGFGPRIVATRWEVTDTTTFSARVHVEGIDRHGILQELIHTISTQLNIDIRGLNISANNEVFTADLQVLVADTAVVEQLCAKIRRLNGVQRAARVS